MGVKWPSGSAESLKCIFTMSLLSPVGESHGPTIEKPWIWDDWLIIDLVTDWLTNILIYYDMQLLIDDVDNTVIYLLIKSLAYRLLNW